jgi:hypothetical protein
MVSNSPPGGSVLADDQGWNDASDRPLPLDGELASHAALHFQPTDHILHVIDSGLDLDHEQDPHPWMEGEKIDPAAVPVIVEARLDLHKPPCVAEELRHPVLKNGMASIELRSLAAYPNVEDEVRPERACPCVEELHRARSEVAAFQPAQPLLADSQQGGQSTLGPALSAAKAAEQACERTTLHDPIIAGERLSPRYVAINAPEA